MAMCLGLFGHSVQFGFGCVVGQMNVFIVIAMYWAYQNYMIGHLRFWAYAKSGWRLCG